MIQTEQKNTPKLRFPEFDGVWKDTTIKSAAEFRRGSFPQPYGLPEWYDEVNGKPFVQVFDVAKDFRLKKTTKQKISAEAESKSVFVPKNSIILTIQGSIGRIAITQYDAYVDRTLLIFTKYNIDLDTVFFTKVIFLLFEREKKFAPGGTIKTITKEVLSSFIFSYPALPEQQKIGKFFAAVDERISQLDQKKELLEDYKRGLTQKLLSQKIRFKDKQGNKFPDWQTKPLHEFLFETKERSDRTEPVYSVSVHKGLVDQIEHLGRSYSAADTGHYNRVNPGDIVYTKSPTGDFPLGIIKQSLLNHSVIVSPLYGVFRPETIWLGYWLHVYFGSSVHTGNYLKPIIQKGAKNTISITNTIFLSAKLKIPTHPDEQRKIADFLVAIERKIALVSGELELALAFKKSLLQQMFI